MSSIWKIIQIVYQLKKISVCSLLHHFFYCHCILKKICIICWIHWNNLKSSFINVYTVLVWGYITSLSILTHFISMQMDTFIDSKFSIRTALPVLQPLDSLVINNRQLKYLRLSVNFKVYHPEQKAGPLGMTLVILFMNNYRIVFIHSYWIINIMQPISRIQFTYLYHRNQLDKCPDGCTSDV